MAVIHAKLSKRMPLEEREKTNQELYAQRQSIGKRLTQKRKAGQKEFKAGVIDRKTVMNKSASTDSRRAKMMGAWKSSRASRQQSSGVKSQVRKIAKSGKPGKHTVYDATSNKLHMFHKNSAGRVAHTGSGAGNQMKSGKAIKKFNKMGGNANERAPTSASIRAGNRVFGKQHEVSKNARAVK